MLVPTQSTQKMVTLESLLPSLSPMSTSTILKTETYYNVPPFSRLKLTLTRKESYVNSMVSFHFSLAPSAPFSSGKIRLPIEFFQKNDMTKVV